MEELKVDLKKLFDEIDQMYESDRLRPGEFTISTYAEAQGIKYKEAVSRVEKALRAGLIETVDREALVNGKRIKRIYRPCQTH